MFDPTEKILDKGKFFKHDILLCTFHKSKLNHEVVIYTTFCSNIGTSFITLQTSMVNEPSNVSCNLHLTFL